MMKTVVMGNRYSLIIGMLLVFCSSESRAQPRYQAPLPDSLKSGFYFIPLPPALIGHSKYHLEDLRIFDRDDREVPYVTWDDPGVFAGSRFLAFPVLSYKKDTDRQTHLILKADNSGYVNALVLKLRATAATRRASISGSTDGKTWFAIRDDFSLTEDTRSEGAEMLASIRIPPSVYNYYDVTILGKGVLPPDIVAAGIYREFNTPEYPMRIAAPATARKDSTDGASHITLHFDADYKIDELRFYVSGPALYHRKVYAGLAGSTSYDVAEAYLTSTNKPHIISVALQGKDLSILIENGNSPALVIDSIVAYQHNRFLLAYLEARNNYRLVCGDSALHAPLYDLAYFKDSAKASAVQILPGTLGAYVEQNPRRDIRATGNAVEQPRSYKWLLWLTLGFVSVLIVGLVIKMMREVKGRQ